VLAEVVQPPAAAPAPAPAEPPVPPAPKTWKDADCSHTSSTLPSCSAEFSDNSASVTVVPDNVTAVPVIQLATVAGPLVLSDSPNNAVRGSKAVYGVSFLHKLPLADYPGITFDAKFNTGDSTVADELYVTITVSPHCDGQSYVNLITQGADMTPMPGADGYSRYSATPAEVKWYRTGSKTYPVDTTSSPLLLNGAQSGNPAMSLAAFEGAFPNACIWNFPNPTTQVPGGVTPALDFNLGDSGTITGKKAWIRSISIGDKSVF